MRYLLLAILFLFTTNLNAQSLYASLDGVERAEIGIETKGFHFFTGYTQADLKGDYMHVGAGYAYGFELAGIPLKGMADLRGYFGSYDANVMGDPTKSESGVAYSFFLGYDLGKVAIGSRLEQYISGTDNIYLSPVSVKVNL